MSPQLAERERAEIPSAANQAAGESSWLSYGLATVIYLLATGLTRPIFMSDTMYYLRTANPSSLEFWDFGHLFWRALLWILLRHLDDPDVATRFLHAFRILDFLSTAAGLAALWCVLGTLRLFTRKTPPAAISATVLSFSQAVLTHSKGGCAYIFGFLALSAGSYAIVSAARSEQGTWYRAGMAGVFLALAICLWFPYIFAVPGALLAPLLFSKQQRDSWRIVIAVASLCAVLSSASYGIVAMHLGIRTIHGLAAWAQRSSHGVTTSGAPRVAFGFARSFISLGEGGSHGVVFKRFVLHDPYNPVHISQVIGVTLGKMVLFYVFLGFIFLNLPRSPKGFSVSLELLLTAIPVLGFAVLWAGTDLERYLPLFPVLMLAVGVAVDNMRLRSAAAYIVIGFTVALVFANLWSLSAIVRQRQLRELTTTVRSLNDFLPSDSLVLLPPMHPLQRIYWDFPEALPLAEHGLKLERIVDLGTNETAQWQKRLCSHMSQRWNKQIPVVIESSLLQTKPAADSSWVEGDDPRVYWKDISGFTSKLEIGNQVGDTNFFWISATATNVERINHCR